MVEPTAADEEVAPTCYRHPGRETWVRCNRCERPICPDCMRDAAVGFQCPECVREGNKTVRQHRTVFGGLVGADGSILTKWLIGINVVLFFVSTAQPAFENSYSLISINVAAGDYYRLLTAAFLHANFVHIGFNMFSLLLFGPVVEQALGRSRFITLYLLSALGGSALSYLLHAPLVRVSGGVAPFQGLGASGAVFGLFGAYFVIARRLRADTSQIVGLIVINLVLGFALSNTIDNFAHIGGLVTGAAVTAALANVPPGRWRSLIQAGACAVVGIALVGLVAVRTHQLREDCVGLGSVSVSCLAAAGGQPPG